MKLLRLSAIILFLFSMLFSTLLPAMAGNLKAGVWNAPPYVMIDNNGSVSGFTIEVWKSIARDAHIACDYVTCDNAHDIISGIQKGELDVGLGPLAISAQGAERVTFTQPYSNSEVGIMMQTSPPSLWDRIRPFLTAAFSTSVLLFAFLLLLVGTLLWLAERRENSVQFHQKWSRGVWDGIWLALSVLTTVGFGDVVPRTRAGKAVCALWMLSTMVLASVITAGLATVLTSIYTIERLPSCTYNDPAQLNGKHVAVIRGTLNDTLARHWGGIVVEKESLEAAVDVLKRGAVDVVVDNRMALLYYLAKHPDRRLAVSSASFDSESLAFALPILSELYHKVNTILITLRETGKLSETTQHWLSSLQDDGNYHKTGTFKGPFLKEPHRHPSVKHSIL